MSFISEIGLETIHHIHEHLGREGSQQHTNFSSRHKNGTRQVMLIGIEQRGLREKDRELQDP